MPSPITLASSRNSSSFSAVRRPFRLLSMLPILQLIPSARWVKDLGRLRARWRAVFSAPCLVGQKTRQEASGMTSET